MRREFSAGGVVIKKERGRPRVLLIKDSYGRWTWPKGHIEEGESSREAARREISEETGLTKLEVMDKLGDQKYYFTLKGEKVFKVVNVFLVCANAREKLDIQVEEISDARWYWPEDALARADYDGAGDYIRDALDKFRGKVL